MTIAALALEPAAAEDEFLAQISDEQLIKFVSRHCGLDEPPEVWDMLMSDSMIGRTKAALAALVNDVNMQFAARTAGLESQRGKPPEAYQAAKRQFNEWRYRTIGYKRLLDRRVQLVKAALAKKQAAQQSERATARSLARAIARHRERVLDSGASGEDMDLDLWAVLDTATVPLGGGTIAVAQWIANGA